MPPGQKSCRVAHGKAGHKKGCERFQAKAKAVATEAEAQGGADGGDGGEGGDGGGTVRK